MKVKYLYILLFGSIAQNLGLEFFLLKKPNKQTKTAAGFPAVSVFQPLRFGLTEAGLWEDQ